MISDYPEHVFNIVSCNKGEKGLQVVLERYVHETIRLGNFVTSPQTANKYTRTNSLFLAQRNTPRCLLSRHIPTFNVPVQIPAFPHISYHRPLPQSHQRKLS